MIYAKTLRLIVQRAEAAKYSGKILPLSSVVIPLFNHVWDVLSNVPRFQSEYGIILRHLLAVRDYSFQMRKCVYCSLVMLYIEKVEASLNGKNISHFTSKEEGFVKICSFIREEGKISRKLVECINTYLLNDGPNLGFQLLEIHNAMQEFMFQCWLTTHDRDSLMDLDQGSVSSNTMPRVDGNMDDKLGTLSSSQCGLVELAAVLFYR
ncbi:unnamed protein product [Trifolium pratense]|uniref:Uncharacterized protein n=1 Tax=Trifolium pratense TaxID=57577 RepID=A0ACB0LT92_TRIPR|nr:unnamed protein product [Trifolium pratense]